MLLQQAKVQIKHRLDEHPQGGVYQLEFLTRELSAHDLEQLVGQLDILDAVFTILLGFLCGEIGAALALCVMYLEPFLADTVTLCECAQGCASLHTVQTSTHAHGIKPHLWLHVVAPAKDGSVEHRVLCKDSSVREVYV